MLSINSPSTSSSTTTTSSSTSSSTNPRSHPPLKHNVIERDKVVVPPHWDSWGKIRVLREGFDVEGINRGWSIDVDPANNRNHTTDSESAPVEPELEGGALQIYEEVIKDTYHGPIGSEALDLLHNGRTGIEVPPVDTQEFLAAQAEALDAKLAEEKQARLGGDTSAQKDRDRKEEERRRVIEEGAERVLEHVGPVQFNVGGIQVDAENMLERLKVSFLSLLRRCRWYMC